MKSWYDWKDRINKKSGFQFGINYTALYLNSSKVISDENNPNTASGIIDIYVGWNFINRKADKNKGKFFIKFTGRHSYGGDELTSPQDHGLKESGYYGLSGTGFNDFSARIFELNYQQLFANNRLGFVVGKIDLTNYFNFHGLSIPSQHFIGYGSSNTGTGNWGNPGLGGVFMVRPAKEIYVLASVVDVYGDLYQDGDFFDLGQHWENGDLMYMGEIGYFPDFKERFDKRISLMGWISDEYVSVGGDQIARGEGLAFSAHWLFRERYMPYLGIGFSNGAGENTFYKKDIQIGHGIRFKRYDILGTSFSWAETNIAESKDQMTVEVFYRYNITSHFEITADFQYIVNPTLNPTEGGFSYWGLRGRLKL